MRASSKVLLKKGRGASQSTLFKLTVSLIAHGHVTTTAKRGAYLKSHIDKLVYKALKNDNASINVLKRFLKREETLKRLVNDIAPQMKDRVSGFVKMIKHPRRVGDNAYTVTLSWVVPIEELKKKKVSKVKQKKLLSTDKKRGSQNKSIENDTNTKSDDNSKVLKT